MSKIMSASYREDIPCFKSKEFMKNYREGLYNDYDFIVFWTKYNQFTMDELKEIKIPFYFQYTINSYGIKYEPFKGPVSLHHIVNEFRRISEIFGKNRIIWRYDPILIKII